VKRGLAEKLLLGLGIVGALLFSLAPYAWFASIAFKPQVEITAIPPLLFPHKLTLESFRATIYQYGLLHFIQNSVIVATLTTIACVSVASPAAYALARLDIPLRRMILLGILSVAMFPQISTAGPVWRILRAVGWLSTYQGLIIPYVALTVPLAVWILANFFRELPRELEEAAKIDGASLFQTLTRVIMPLAAPGLFTAAILTFVYAWNEFFFALLIMSEREVQTLPVGIALFPGEYTMPWGEIASASTMATLPLIVLALLFQKRIISGLTAGAVKG
jgi:multiple sugar transport system permease protein